MSDPQIEKLLAQIQAKVASTIDGLNINTAVKAATKQAANQLIKRIPSVVQQKRTRGYVARLLENRYIQKNTTLQKQIGAAYWAIKTAMQKSAEEREASVKELVNTTCPSMTQEKRDAISKLISQKCSTYSCDAQTYWDIFQQVDAACWIGLLQEK